MNEYKTVTKILSLYTVLRVPSKVPYFHVKAENLSENEVTLMYKQTSCSGLEHK